MSVGPGLRPSLLPSSSGLEESKDWRAAVGWLVCGLVGYLISGLVGPLWPSQPANQPTSPPPPVYRPYLFNQQPLRVALARGVAEVVIRGPGQVEGWKGNDERSSLIPHPSSLIPHPSSLNEVVIRARPTEVPSEEVMYRLVIGRYTDRAKADADAASIRQRGLKAYVKPDGEGVLVQVDGFLEAAWAQTLQRRVASAGYRDCRVETYAPLRRSAYLSVTVDGTEVPETDLREVKVGAVPPCQPSATLGQTSTTGSLLTVEIPPAAACPYRGAVAVRVGPDGRLVVINEVLLDDYLRGVLPLEMDPDFDIEALQAQAVAARTYALSLLTTDGRWPMADGRLAESQIANRKSQIANSEGYHFAVPNTQAYGGVRAETARTDACVSATRGEVLTFEGRLVHTFFHTVCGGQTEDVINVWGMDAPCLTSVRDGPKPISNLATPEGISNFLNAHSDSYCRDSPDYRWTVSFSRAQLQVLLERTLPRVLERKDVALGPLEDLRVEERSPNGRVLALAVVGRDHTYVVRRDAIRWLFGTGYAGTAGLKSTLFVIQRSADGSRYTFLGGGWGHGAGLCQQGAQGLARAGHTYQEILRHYYPGAVLTRF